MEEAGGTPEPQAGTGPRGVIVVGHPAARRPRRHRGLGRRRWRRRRRADGRAGRRALPRARRRRPSPRRPCRRTPVPGDRPTTAAAAPPTPVATPAPTPAPTDDRRPPSAATCRRRAAPTRRRRRRRTTVARARRPRRCPGRRSASSSRRRRLRRAADDAGRPCRPRSTELLAGPATTSPPTSDVSRAVRRRRCSTARSRSRGAGSATVTRVLDHRRWPPATRPGYGECVGNDGDPLDDGSYQYVATDADGDESAAGGFVVGAARIDQRFVNNGDDPDLRHPHRPEHEPLLRGLRVRRPRSRPKARA